MSRRRGATVCKPRIRREACRDRCNQTPQEKQLRQSRASYASSRPFIPFCHCRVESKRRTIYRMKVLEEQRAAERLGMVQVLALILSVYVLVALFIQATVKLSPDTIKALDWIDFVSSIPMLNIFRVGRVVRIVRVFRILRAFRSTKYLVVYFLRYRKATSFAAVAATSFCI